MMAMVVAYTRAGVCTQDGAVPDILPHQLRLRQPGEVPELAGGRPRRPMGRAARERQGEPLLLLRACRGAQHRPAQGRSAGAGCGPEQPVFSLHTCSILRGVRHTPQMHLAYHSAGIASFIRSCSMTFSEEHAANFIVERRVTATSDFHCIHTA